MLNDSEGKLNMCQELFVVLNVTAKEADMYL